MGKTTCEEEQLEEIGKAVSDAVQEAWRKSFEDKIAKPLDLSSHSSNVYLEAKRQIEQHLDIQWLFQALSDNSDAAYRRAYDELNKNLNALKNTRPFHTSEERGRKCSLDGERNVIFYRLSQGQIIREKDNAPLYSTTNFVFGYDDKHTIIKLRHLQPGEGLSAVSMLKRYSDFDHANFPSTAEFALADMMKAVRSIPAGEMAFLEMLKHFKANEDELNWQVFYDENLNDNYFKKQGLKVSVGEAKKIQSKITNIAKGLDKSRNLEKYYALVVFDGDHMGKWWKGDRIKNEERLEDFHRDLTAKLADFARLVSEEYPKENQHRGWIIYAGGDDFLGFFNLHHLTDAINFLRNTYHDAVHVPLAHRIDNDHTLTFSAGVCIVHYKEPLSLVLAQAREMEHMAKELDERKKNAIGLGVIPGSGQVAKVVLPFDEFANLGIVISNLQIYDPVLQKPCFSNAFVSKARTELAAFSDKNGKLIDELVPTAQKLLDRAVSRACNLIKNDNETEEDFQKRKSNKVLPLQNAVKALLDANGNKLDAFFDALDIADFIERQTHISVNNPEPSNV
ncbi:MAG: type III-B CRISPR-associated protein Cas10/Cmr2 [Saprospiraceae bacterium]